MADRERKKLDEQERRCRERLAAPDTDEELRRSLEQQIEVIQSRHAAHADAKRRMELVDAELGRLRQQVSLVREQALLVTEEGNMAQSLDAVSASLNEANRWLKDQRELFAGLDNFTDEPPPADLLASKRAVKRARQGFRVNSSVQRRSAHVLTTFCTRLGRRQHHHVAAAGRCRRPGRMAVAGQERRAQDRG